MPTPIPALPNERLAMANNTTTPVIPMNAVEAVRPPVNAGFVAKPKTAPTSGGISPAAMSMISQLAQRGAQPRAASAPVESPVMAGQFGAPSQMGGPDLSRFHLRKSAFGGF